jgi:hypothetical protein
MSRSFSSKRRIYRSRKVSEKRDKKIWHSAYRKAVSVKLSNQIKKDDEIIFPEIKEHSEPWTMMKETRRRTYIIKSRTRKEIDSVLREISKGIITKNYITPKMMNYFGIDDPVELLKISPGKINLFISYYLKNMKRK